MARRILALGRLPLAKWSDKRREDGAAYERRFIGAAAFRVSEESASVTTYRAHALADLSMISANYGNLDLAEDIHRDWFRFLGGTPREVVFVENGSPLVGQTVLFEGVKSGWITKLLSVRPGSFDIGKHQAFIAEVSALAMATRPNVLLYHLDVLVARRGHDDWLVDALKKLADPKVFAIGGSFNAPSKIAEHDDDWYVSNKLSGNFALLPRGRYREAWQRVAGSFLRSGYREEHPLPVATRRFVMEVGLERLLESAAWRTLVRRETRDWSIFHTNLNGADLGAARARFLSGRGIERYLNAGDSPVLEEVGKQLKYFGHPEVSRVRKLRIAIGASSLGPIVRRLLGREDVAQPPETEPPTVRDLASRGKSPLDQLAVVVWVDDARALAGGLGALYNSLGGRPAQVLGLLPAGDPAADQAWQAHLEGSTDKLLVSRRLPVGGGISLATMVDHGVFAHAHSPDYLLCRASKLAASASWVPQALERLHTATTLPSTPDNMPLELADVALHRRLDLMQQVEAGSPISAMLGLDPPGPDGLSASPRQGAA
jgi:hypothetical protein